MKACGRLTEEEKKKGRALKRKTQDTQQAQRSSSLRAARLGGGKDAVVRAVRVRRAAGVLQLSRGAPGEVMREGCTGDVARSGIWRRARDGS